jgi:alkanesulfonate monooxygenase SsuD/methylene tetrahydromethanopterin reductase-like flavin-dependent oxidoreductase (luciferase family)
MPPLQFGLALSPGLGWFPGSSRETFVADIRRTLDRVTGVFDSFWMPDHFQVQTFDVLECWSSLSYFAGLYPALKFGSIVISHSFRNPAMLAKMAATLHYLTDGRLILGLGAGWNKEEYLAYGYDFPPNGVRVDQFGEALQVITTLWRESPATFTGRHYTIKDALCEPRYSTPPPLMVGGEGPRMLRLAARHADWWNASWSGPTEYRQLVERLTQACAEVGRDPATIRKTWLGLCSCAPTEEAAHRALEGGAVIDSASRGLVGTPEQIVQKLRPFIEAGMDYWMVVTPRFPDLTTLDLLIDEVMPRLKAEYGA